MKKICSFVLMTSMIVGVIIAKNLSPLGMSTQKEDVGISKSENVLNQRLKAKGASAGSLSVVVSGKSMALTFDNDEVQPWTIGDGFIQSGKQKQENGSSTLSFSYQSDKKTEVSFEWMNTDSRYHTLKMYADGICKGEQNGSSWNTVRFFLDKGKHIVTFEDTISDYRSYYNQWGLLRNICVREILPLESAVLTAKSQPLKFVNESEYPWTIEDGYIQSGNYNYQNTSSRFSTTFKIDKVSKFSFERCSGRYDGGFQDYYRAGDYHNSSFYINGKLYSNDYNRIAFGTSCVVLTPGTYTVEWVDTMNNNSSYTYLSQIRNIELSSNWINIDLPKAGTLGVDVLYQVSVLDDVELLKVTGNLNSDDWANIKKMNNLMGLDLSGAKCNSVPNSAFDGLSRLSYVVLPEGIESIGQYAFRGTQIQNITIPSSVKTIGQYAFNDVSRLASVNFAKDSQLQYIGYKCFSGTGISEFIMPNSVAKLGSENHYNEDRGDYYTYVFSDCVNLKKIHFSDALMVLENYVCNNCYNLEDVELPKNLEVIRNGAFYRTSSLRSIKFPESLRTIDNEAFYQTGLDSVKLPTKLTSLASYVFYDSDNIKYVELPSYMSSYDRCFSNCNGIEKIVCKSATPPSVANDIIEGGPDKSKVTLVVPSFSVANYKLDSYWYRFGDIQEMNIDLDYWRIASALSLTNNRRMGGKPDVELYYEGQLMVSGNAPMILKNFDIFVSESNPSRLLNDCASMTADQITSHFSVDANRWYFLTPLHDIDLTKVTHSNNASFVFRYYDGASRAANGTGNSWKNVDNGKLLAGKGYIFQCNSSGMINLPCAAASHVQVLNTNDVTTRLETHEATASANKNWNYVGNPYPAYYDVYYMDFTAPITVWTGDTYKAYSIVDDEFVLRPMQSFFVQKPDAVDNIVFHKEGRQMTSGIERASTAKARTQYSSNLNRKFFNLEISNDEDLKDETRLVINEKAQMGYELELDASKFMSMNAAVPQIFTLDDEGISYAINERPLESGSIALGYLAAKDGFYTISAVKAEGEIMLFDKEQNKYIDLSAQDYTFFTHSTNGVNKTRFVLKINTKGGTITDINSAATSKTKITGSKGSVVITTDTDAHVVVNSLSGVTVFNGQVSAGNQTISLPTGIYIIKVNNTSSKIIVY